MKIVYSWLKDFVDVSASPNEVAEALTRAGIEVDSVTPITIPQGVKVARVLSVSRHPNADKLSLCLVDAGEEKQYQIVCGAPNVKEGMLGALATEGTNLGDFTIKKTKIRGIESNGMLCSEEELSLADESEGIISLPEHYQVGDELSKYIEDDALIEIEITPDRGDCLSIRGVAREVAASFGLQVKNTAKKPKEDTTVNIGSAISVQIEDPSKNPRYMGRLVRDVTIAPSPDWMQRRLTQAGIRPINNIVDVTNYILIEYGQPMHAFDYNKIEDQKITITTAGSSTAFTTLDGIERQLLDSDLLICDGKRPVALAGIMGGAGSEISADTRNVFLECAFFDPVGVRKTSKRLGLSTDSSYRFERGVDPDQGLVDALDTAAALIQEISGGKVDSGKIDIYPQPLKQKQIAIRPKRAKQILGVEISADQIISYFTSLQFSCSKQDDSILCTIPLFRHDIVEEIDLIEEVGRLYGYDNIPVSETAPVSLLKEESVIESKRDMARFALSYHGFNEIITNSMISEKKNALTAPDMRPVKLLNPLNPEMSQLRTSMVASLVETVAYNLNRKNQNNCLFEIGKVYQAEENPASLPVERDILAVVIEGNFWKQSWNNTPRPCDFFILKGILEAFAAHCRIGALSFQKAESPVKIYGENASFISADFKISGSAGKVSKEICSFFDIKSSLFYAELDITEWLRAKAHLTCYKPLPKYPSLQRDFSFVMPEELSSSVVEEEIRSVSPLVEDVTPFDLFRGEKLGEDRKSVTFSVSFRSPEKTLTDKEVERICKKIISNMKMKYGATLRI
ncbi:Phenylalanyl-tRNA synthetase beta chain [Chitinispirillum alkaliphilum]|nr:Phenylalanyl-tRNA synthetase beta chain [Chitinispirillum alkaliphilum]